MFDSSKKGSIEKEKVRTILTTLGHTYDDNQLDALLQGEDPEGLRDCLCVFFFSPLLIILCCFHLQIDNE